MQNCVIATMLACKIIVKKKLVHTMFTNPPTSWIKLKGQHDEGQQDRDPPRENSSSERVLERAPSRASKIRPSMTFA